MGASAAMHAKHTKHQRRPHASPAAAHLSEESAAAALTLAAVHLLPAGALRLIEVLGAKAAGRPEPPLLGNSSPLMCSAMALSKPAPVNAAAERSEGMGEPLSALGTAGTIVVQ